MKLNKGLSLILTMSMIFSNSVPIKAMNIQNNLDLYTSENINEIQFNVNLPVETEYETVGDMNLQAIDPILNPAQDNWLSREIAKIIFGDESKFNELTQQHFNIIKDLRCSINDKFNIPKGIIPSQIGNLVNLEKISIKSSNNLDLPKRTSRSESLESLEADGLELDVYNIIDQDVFSKLNCSVNTEEVDIELSISSILDNDKNLVLPEEIENLSNLTHLHLEGFISNDEDLKELGKLKSLEVLLLLNNKISKLPKSIGNLINLKVVKIYDFALSFLPNEMSNLNNINILILGYVMLGSIPHWTYTLPNLKVSNWHCGEIYFLKKLNSLSKN